MELYVVCTHKNRLIEAILMSTLNTYNYCVEDLKEFPKLSPWRGDMINPQGLELPIPRKISMVHRCSIQWGSSSVKPRVAINHIAKGFLWLSTTDVFLCEKK